MTLNHSISRVMILATLLSALPIHAVIAQLADEVSLSDGGARRRGSKEVISTRSTPIGRKNSIEDADTLVRFGDRAPRYNYVVGISYSDPRGRHTCTGTLVGKKLVLTAAHCACGTNYSVTQDMVMNGGTFIPVEGPPILFDAGMCQRGSVRPGYDLALLRLARDADIDPQYRPMPRLAGKMLASMRTGMNLLVVGYGLTEKQILGERMQAFVPVFTPDCAKLQYIMAGCAPYFEMILSATTRTEGPRTADTCSGDSGGPVFVMEPAPDGKLMPSLVAVTSRPAPLSHADAQNHCGGGGIYTVVGRMDVLQWLLNHGVEEPLADQAPVQCPVCSGQ